MTQLRTVGIVKADGYRYIYIYINVYVYVYVVRNRMTVARISVLFEDFAESRRVEAPNPRLVAETR